VGDRDVDGDGESGCVDAGPEVAVAAPSPGATRETSPALLPVDATFVPITIARKATAAMARAIHRRRGRADRSIGLACSIYTVHVLASVVLPDAST
jgi:hypothetical protein